VGPALLEGHLWHDRPDSQLIPETEVHLAAWIELSRRCTAGSDFLLRPTALFPAIATTTFSEGLNV